VATADELNGALEATSGIDRISASGRPERRPSSGPSQRIQSVDRAVSLLKAIADSPQPMSVLTLAASCRLNRATAWRLLGTLEHHGLVARDPATQGYVIGHEVTRLASNVSHDPLVRIARPVLERYANQLSETLTLAVPGRAELIYVDQIDPPGISRPSWLGKPLALHATSGGKVFLASLSSAELEAILPEAFPRFTDHTITDRLALLEELEQTRSRGYGTCDREYEEFSNGVAAAVRGYRQGLIAVVAIWGPSQRLAPTQFPFFGGKVADIAAEVAALLAKPRASLLAELPDDSSPSALGGDAM
jgi:DNA-binding IclR family transcriptional regulator